MNNKTLNKRTLSPLQTKIKPVMDVRSENNPAREAVRALCGSPFSIQISFREDTDTLARFSHVPGLIGILCEITKDGKLLALGRSVSVFSKLNKFVDRTISCAVNGAFLSATNNAVKILESVRVNGEEETEGLGGSLQYQEFQPASEKQKSYLLQLVNANVEDDDEREQLKSKIENISKEEASEMIGGFLNKTINY